MLQQAQLQLQMQMQNQNQSPNQTQPQITAQNNVFQQQPQSAPVPQPAYSLPYAQMDLQQHLPQQQQQQSFMQNSQPQLQQQQLQQPNQMPQIGQQQQQQQQPQTQFQMNTEDWSSRSSFSGPSNPLQAPSSMMNVNSTQPMQFNNAVNANQPMPCKCGMYA
jgi:hypothetical protein